MSSKSSILAWAAMALLAFGCNKSSDNSGAKAPPAAALNAAKAVPDAASQDPKVVVTRFLEAMRSGDNDAATRLLTKVARQKAEEAHRPVASKANDGIRIEVEDADYPTPAHDIAHVPAKWIDQDGLGNPRTEKTIVVCRLEAEGWRVGGVADFVFEGEDPVLLNFENPDDMAKQKERMNQEIERRAKQDTTAPAGTENSSQAARKPQDAFRR